jgi:hypothetical protein
VTSAEAALRYGGSFETAYRIAAGWAASLLGAALCLGFGRVLQRTSWRALAPSMGIVLVGGCLLAMAWSALFAFGVAPLGRTLFELAGVALAPGGPPRPPVASTWWVFVSWGAVWLSITYADDLRRSEARAEQAHGRVLELEGLVEALRSPAGGAELWAPTRRGAVRLSAQDVVSFDAERDYVRLHATDGEQYLIRATLQGLLARLGLSGFLRVHRSCAVNLRHVARVEGFGARGLALHLSDGRRTIVGRSYIATVRRTLAASAPPA